MVEWSYHDRLDAVEKNRGYVKLLIMHQGDCFLIRNELSKSEEYFCKSCARKFIPEGAERNSTLLEIYNLIKDDTDPLEFAESVVVYIKTQVK